MRNYSWLGILIILLLFGALGLFFSKSSPVSIPKEDVCVDCNIIVISMTNLRYDHMSQNGYFRKTTPNLDALAKEAVVFDNAFGHSSWTLPEAISIYTSLYPYSHGVMNRHDGTKLSPKIPTLIDVLKKQGYETAAFTGGFDYSPNFGLTDRLTHYEECRESTSKSNTTRVGVNANLYGFFNCTTKKALAWLTKNSNKKFFIHLQGFDAHCPFDQGTGELYDGEYSGTVDYSNCLWTFDRTDPVTKNGKQYYPVYSPSRLDADETVLSQRQILLDKSDIYHLTAKYDETIHIADQQIGAFLEEIKKLGLYDNSIIIFTSEHGDMFGKNGRFMRGGPLRGTFYDDVLHVPLVIRNPKMKLTSTKKIDGLAQQIDLFPTLLDFSGIENNLKLEGKSLIPLVFFDKNVNQYVFAGSRFSPNPNSRYYAEGTTISAIRSKDWKLIEERFASKTQTTSKELYNIARDPKEERNVADKSTLDRIKFQLLLYIWSKKTESSFIWR